MEMYPRNKICLDITHNAVFLSQLRGRAVYAYVFLKNVDGQGTQSIIKNLNSKKSKRVWNQNFIEVIDYTV